MTYRIEDFIKPRMASPATGESSRHLSCFSSDGSKVLIQSNITGTMQLYTVPLNGGQLSQVTDFAEPASGAYLPGRGELIVQMDEGGNERHQIYLAADTAPAALEKIVFDPDYIHAIGGVTPDGSTIAYGSNRRNAVNFDIYVRDLASGDEKCVFDRPGAINSVVGFSPDGRFLCVMQATDRSADNDLFLVDIKSGEIQLVSQHEGESAFGTPSWLPDSSGFFFATDDGREFSGIARYDMSAASWSYVLEADADLGCVLERSGKYLLISVNEGGYSKLTLNDTSTLKVVKDIELPGRGVVTTKAFSPDGGSLVYGFISDTQPADTWRYDINESKLTRLTESPDQIPPADLAQSEIHEFNSFDGEQIPLWFYKPKGVTRPAPAIVWVHGGPESQQLPIYNPIIQYLVHRGFAVAAPNVRGSTGYGKRYHHLDDRRKRLDSVEDLRHLHRYLSSTGIVDPRRIALMGGSYGGFMTLAGLAFQPDLWAAGVDVVGISSWPTFLKNTSAWRRRAREREYGTIEDDYEFLVAASPLTHVDKINAPLFIIHGTNDPRVPLSEARQIHKAVTSKGLPAEMVVYDDEGHGLGKIRNQLDAYPKVAAFLEKNLSD